MYKNNKYIGINESADPFSLSDIKIFYDTLYIFISVCVYIILFYMNIIHIYKYYLFQVI